MFFHRNRVLAGAVTLTIACSVASVSAAYATPSPTDAPSISTQKSNGKGISTKHAAGTSTEFDPAFAGQAQQMEADLKTIMSIPDEVLLQGDAATQTWVQQNLVTGTPGVTTYASVLGCTGAITGMIAGNLVGAAKLLKIKRYIKELGGVAEAVRVMWGASFSYEKLQALGGAVGALAAELVGIAGVQEKCFD
ncbi:hypothetical protein [Corynebacterium coyleae]|uniref:hypothetical protein n=1 Tax=Corynebacterium coyleae TaxID=53374 RepID=UPI00254CC831|nr:hypothetical protein [Corynebacterium coyleae]MDK8799382.1 hypothetical protein [Corynebacterium coyleae]